ncbi:hypothetical protein EHS25_002763 [Saitozyma podzolica]|uniref:D-serine dehydratase n=1 Tax=Saitozyma podzolica TaxID=1890683 RepID=A0A427YDQ4_9TREE|nr:hypothetical protein EHS25_002763 [Saitozyma podzolica]
MKFRAHVKTHKTAEGTRMQVQAAGGVRALIASTMPEVWQIILSGLVAEGLVDDILYSMPLAASRLEDINDAQSKCGDKAVIRLMVDHPEQIAALEAFSRRSGRKQRWSVFMKVDGGGRRAGVPPQSEQMRDNIKAALASDHVEIYGFYSHFGQSYASKSLSKASEYLSGEVECVNSAARVARDLGATNPFVLSVGATPTAHAATQGAGIDEGLEGALELALLPRLAGHFLSSAWIVLINPPGPSPGSTPSPPTLAQSHAPGRVAIRALAGALAGALDFARLHPACLPLVHASL